MSVRARWVVVVGGVASWAALSGLPRIADASELNADRGCALSHMSIGEARTTSCVSCHRSGSGSSHPVDMEYAPSAALRYAGAGNLRPAEEVVRRGIYLANGRVDCLTCHDPRSPWKNHIALPPGAKAMPAVDPRKPETYEEGPVRRQKIAELQAPQLHGDQRLEVTAKPLCLGCHALD